MKLKHSLIALAIPGAAAAYLAFQPGPAFAATSLMKQGPSTFPSKGTFSIDPMHSGVGFEVTHMGISKVQGKFTKLSGTIFADRNDPGKSSVNVSIETSSVDTSVAARDNHLRSATFFDVAKYPTITFKSTRIHKSGSGYVALGDLTMHGVTHQIRIPFKIAGPIKDPMGATRIGIVTSPITLLRGQYDMGADTPMVSDEVGVQISVEATLNK